MQTFVRSRYNVVVSLKAGRSLAYNSLSGGFALWDQQENEVYQSVESASELDETERQRLFPGTRPPR